MADADCNAPAGLFLDACLGAGRRLVFPLEVADLAEAGGGDAARYACPLWCRRGQRNLEVGGEVGWGVGELAGAVECVV